MHPHFSAFDLSALEGFSASRRTSLWTASPLMSISWSYNTKPEMMAVSSVREWHRLLVIRPRQHRRPTNTLGGTY